MPLASMLDRFPKENMDFRPNVMRRTFHRALVTLGMCVAITLPASALQNKDEHSLSAVAPETHGAVALGGGLPSVPELVQAHGLDAEGFEELEAWKDSWGMVDGDGALVRATQVYPGVAARLFPILNRPGVAELLRENEESLRSAKRMGVLLANRRVEEALEGALRHHHEAVMALQEGDGERSLRLAFQSADALRAVGPAQVAGDLLERARDQLRRNRDLETYSLEKLTRIRRLTNGAAEALEDGDYPRAIRRAYYACQLLGADSG